MPKIEIEVPDEHVARKIQGLIGSGRAVRIMLMFRARRVVGVEAQESWLEDRVPEPLGAAIFIGQGGPAANTPGG